MIIHFEKAYKTKYDISASFILLLKYRIVSRYFTNVVSGAQTSEEMEEKILHKLNCDVLPCYGADKFEIFLAVIRMIQLENIRDGNSVLAPVLDSKLKHCSFQVEQLSFLKFLF